MSEKSERCADRCILEILVTTRHKVVAHATSGAPKVISSGALSMRAARTHEPLARHARVAAIHEALGADRKAPSATLGHPDADTVSVAPKGQIGCARRTEKKVKGAWRVERERERERESEREVGLPGIDKMVTIVLIPAR